MIIGHSFGVLGSLSVGSMNSVPVVAPKQRALLAALLLYPNRTVPTQTLIEIIWEDDYPKDARGALQIHVTRLRRRLGNVGIDAAVRSVPAGYRVDIVEDDLDLSRFRSLSTQARQARRARDLHSESTLLSEALLLWRGPVLEDISSSVLHRDHTSQVTEELLSAMERRFEVELILGRHDEIIAEIQAAARAHPLRERLSGQLMVAMYRCGRQAEALAAYQAIAGILRRDLGIDPGHSLDRLHQAVLTGSPQLAEGGSDLSGPAGTAIGGTHPPSPVSTWQAICTLPADVSDFVGRVDELSKLSAVLTGRDARDAVPVVTVSGPPGVGKSAFAVHAAHRLRDRFPDGQWYARLTGSEGAARDPAEIIAELLRASGLAPSQIPDGLEALAAAFRARLSDRRVLLTLDDAVNSDQVESLFPGTPGNAVIVTGRDSLTSLVALHGACPIVLDVLSPSEVTILLERLLGHPLTASEAVAATELGALCGRLPLALRVATANIAQRPCELAEYVTDLGKGNRLGKLATGRSWRTDVRATFDAAYRSLPARAQRAFRLLGALPLADFPSDVGMLFDAGQETDTAEDDSPLKSLAAVHLIEEHTADRYQFHDLVRLYAAELASEDAQGGREARFRVLAWYLRSAHAAMDVYRPGLIRLPLPVAIAQGPARTFRTLDSAVGWLDSQRRNLVTAIEHAADHELGELAWCLADAIRGYLWLGQHCGDWLTAAKAGLRAATAAGDQGGVNAMRYSLGLAYRCVGRQREADTCLRRALAGFQQVGAGGYEVAALCETGTMCAGLGALDEAETMLKMGRDRARDLGLRHGLARALRGLGTVHHSQGRLSEALGELTQALDIDREISVIHARPESLRMLALVQADLGMLEDAQAQLEGALASSDSVRARHERAAALAALSMVNTRRGRLAEAVTYGQRALAAAREIGDPVAEAEAFAAMGAAQRSFGNVDAAKAHYNLAIEAARSMEVHKTELDALVGLSRTCCDAGLPAEAIGYAQAAVAESRRFGLRQLEGMSLAALAASYLDLGRPGPACAYAELALSLLKEAGPRTETGRVRTLLQETRLRLVSASLVGECNPL